MSNNHAVDYSFQGLVKISSITVLWMPQVEAKCECTLVVKYVYMCVIEGWGTGGKGTLVKFEPCGA